MFKRIITISKQCKDKDIKIFWMSKNPSERVEAVEIIREHHYSFLGYSEPPRIKKIFTLSPID